MKNNNTCFIDYAIEGDLKKIKEYIVNGIDINVTNECGGGVTALMMASSNCYLEIVKYLVENGANIELVDENNYSALLYASIEGELDR